ncbi:MAG: PIN domain-containing protein [Phormidesmis sp.]
MKVLYDTSVLVPAIISGHPNHSLTFPCLAMAKQKDVQGYLSTHSLAELYSVLTRLPNPLKVSPDEARAIVMDLLGYLVPVSVSADGYKTLIENAASLQLVGGVIFDAIIAQAALVAGVDRLATLNARDFNRLGDKISPLVYVPK